MTVTFGFGTARELVLFAVLALFFGAERLATGFRVRLAEDADLETFRDTDLDAAALFALGRLDFVFIVRAFTAVFFVGRRVVVRDVDRLRPFVTGLLIRRSKI